MRTKAIVAGAVVLVVLLFTFLFFTLARHQPQNITVRHVGSIQSENITTMIFEIKNHTADPYIFTPFEVQVRNGNDWTKVQVFDITKIRPNPLNPGGLASYGINVTNLHDGSVVRFSIRPQKILSGINGLVRRAELNLKQHGGGGGWISMNPKNGAVLGLPSEVVSEEWVEAGR